MADYTTILPPETWLIVMEFLAVPLPGLDIEIPAPKSDTAILKSSPHIRTVSSLSRFFLQLADPYRFREVHFMINLLEVSSIQKLQRIEELLDLLNRRPKVKSWIRSLSMGREYTGRPEAEGDNFGERYLGIEREIHKVLPELQGLSELQCGSIYFFQSLFLGILQLPHLDDLQLEDLRFIQDTADATPNWSVGDQNRSSLRNLTVKALGPPSTSMTRALIHLLKQETLAELTYWPPLFPSARIGASLLWLISSHIPHYVFTHLQMLEIILFPSDIEYFVQLGAQCPNLLSLNVGWNFVDSPKDLKDLLRRGGFTERCFPALQEFEGPFPLAPIFVQGRPVHRVIRDISYGSGRNRSETATASYIAALTPSVALRVLHIAAPRWNETDIEAIAQHHPDIEELVYEHSGEKEMIWSTRLEDAIRKLRKLTRFTSEYSTKRYLSTSGVEDDHPTIVKLRSLCPTLQWARISGLGIWALCPEHKD